MNFETYITKANLFLKEIAIVIGEPENKAKAGRVLTAVLYALRTRLTAEESIHFLAHLPILIKGVYVEGWHLIKLTDQTSNHSDFLSEAKTFKGNTDYEDFIDDRHSLEMIRGVLHVLKTYVRESEIEQMKVKLTDEITDVILN